ncbi:GNAT family N-acyltransferase [Jannaschia donghaensis]|uniref:L-ornithine N(alpha)-acyltransferase n=1 Tax=Jannaschia donghaensis TaxID=420998 RepID=A0A0M6YLA1_9RHOB|nr:GNAT family N-acyltransferase [Jannaschia donghaensis]CTQ50303.1 hypothetical protein JDO7802_02324 [Jannaschia donghaensis]
MEFTVGRWRARLVSRAAADAAMKLRSRVFRNGADDADAFDQDAHHLLIEDENSVVACARLTVQQSDDIAHGYTARHYDLAAFAASFPRALEVGRVCIDPACGNADVPRLLLAVTARVVTAENVSVLYGCSSFPRAGTGMARLAGHIAPALWRPRPRTATVPLRQVPGPLPPLLRSFLALGAGVSDHAVVDTDLGTLHVFTALPIAAIRPGRARLLTGLLDAA